MGLVLRSANGTDSRGLNSCRRDGRKDQSGLTIVQLQRQMCIQKQRRRVEQRAETEGAEEGMFVEEEVEKMGVSLTGPTNGQGTGW